MIKLPPCPSRTPMLICMPSIMPTIRKNKTFPWPLFSLGIIFLVLGAVEQDVL